MRARSSETGADDRAEGDQGSRPYHVGLHENAVTVSDDVTITPSFRLTNVPTCALFSIDSLHHGSNYSTSNTYNTQALVPTRVQRHGVVHAGAVHRQCYTRCNRSHTVIALGSSVADDKGALGAAAHICHAKRQGGHNITWGASRPPREPASHGKFRSDWEQSPRCATTA